ncbi:Na+-transporting ubiquinone oxidoreductase subunit C [Paracholeplasma brassicae]|uniref:Na+-transporting ubiquinone oxidoreductase subunit C n=1 Tax=Acholeplasma brassicae TaxID=61635 RepID=U4KMF4_9MOLU|nr:FMN-binding protein [Paracholeplasma brassicae]CCV65241.1 Na+-transporting ubiquinone oxidoreductase subunit C [Paracholeplasma brassicae]
MRQYINMLVFVVILGSVVSFLLVGADLLTKDRIARNDEALLKSSILDAYDISYSFNTVFERFDETVEEVVIEDTTFYIDKETNRVSYIFKGSGVWGPIEAIMTLEADFKTIVSISILAQEETPGLGGVLAEAWYLEKYSGTVLSDQSPYIIIRHGNEDNLPNEVDAITGGTRTSEAFMKMVNETYPMYKTLFESRGN